MKIRISELTKSYLDADHELTVIDRLSYEFPEGETIAIVGKSGIGKTTLLHLLGGLDLPTSGQIWFDDLDIRSLSQDALAEFRGREVGFVFQFHHLLPEFSALENVALPLIIAGEDDAVAEEKSQEILTQVGLAARLNHRPGELSGGEQQRVAIARAVVTKPAAILADEPTGNLDESTGRAVQELLIGISKERGSTLIVVTHNPDLARAADTVLEMHAGGNLERRAGI